MAHKQIYYSDKYDDEEFEYRHVMLPKDIAKLVPKTHLMSESEWRNLGVQQSQGWVHYMIHEPEPHILLFRRPLPKKPENVSTCGCAWRCLAGVAGGKGSASCSVPCELPAAQERAAVSVGCARPARRD
ncbi:cyclin-dependent kinases regulatory subunit 1 isoform X1 [Rhea pennata]|uniref:cyclin-dependent kinases regulatory subunit 1 isoform X1 n=1 Tax=Rhea pennata TaxID=8795 RepID=UPI002E27200E